MTEGRTVKVERSRARGHVASNTLTVRPGVIKSRARFCFGPLQEARPNKSIPVTKNPLLLPVRFFEASAGSRKLERRKKHKRGHGIFTADLAPSPPLRRPVGLRKERIVLAPPWRSNRK